MRFIKPEQLRLRVTFSQRFAKSQFQRQPILIALLQY